MKYIKRINELFDSQPYKLELIKQESKYWLYSFKSDNNEYIVEFKCGEFGWEAQHSTKSGYSIAYQHFHLAYDSNTLKVTKTIIAALEDFLEKNKPESVFIGYIPAKEDIAKKVINNIYVPVKYNPMNKRARLQFNYLKQIEGYKCQYFYKISGAYFIKTLGFIYRQDINPIDFEEKISELGFKLI